MKRRIIAILFAIMLISVFPLQAFATKTSIQLGGKIGLMYVDTSVTLKPRVKGAQASQIAWSSSNEAVATVNGGTIKAHASGRAIIRAAVDDSEAFCGVVVLPKQIEINIGESYRLPNGTVEKYASQQSSIAKVNDKGVVTGCSKGSTWIRVRYGKQTLYVQAVVNDMGAEALQSEAAKLDCAAETDQIVLVDYKSGSSATLSIHEKRSGVWTQLYSCSAYLGRNGIGKTKEGDGKTPTGTFNLTSPFGIKANPGANSEYTQVTKYHYWCGTSGSEYYNQLVDMRETNRKYTSADEYLINYKGVYNYCMFIDYNANGEAGKGSCIFLHCTGSKKSTAGCIAVQENVMKKIVQWAKSGAKIVIR